MRCDKPHRAEQAGGQRLDETQVLRREAVAELPGDSGVVVVRKLDARHVVDGKVGDFDADFIFAGLEFAGHINRIGRAPQRADALPIEVNDGGFADRRIQRRGKTRPTVRSVASGPRRRGLAEIKETDKPSCNISGATVIVFS